MRLNPHLRISCRACDGRGRWMYLLPSEECEACEGTGHDLGQEADLLELATKLPLFDHDWTNALLAILTANDDRAGGLEQAVMALGDGR